MASSPPNRIDALDGDDVATRSDVAFALQELDACWTQAYEAMGRGDLAQVTALLDQADAQVAAAGDGGADGPAERRLRQRAASAYGLLRHAMQAGLDGIRDELGKHRRGKKALRGYDRTESDAGSRVTRSV